MKIQTPLFFLLCLFSLPLLAQPTPCEDENPDMTPLCEQSCIICDIDGFTGRHQSDVPGIAPAGFCTIVVHNAQWIAFIAGSEELTVNIAVSNCTLGQGLEIGIYQSSDCESFELVSNCQGGTTVWAMNGSSQNISNTDPLTIGQYYYIVMDGAFGDNCDWELTVLDGSTLVSPLTNSGMIEGDNTVCPGITTEYTTQAEEGATEFLWTLDGAEIESDGPSTSIAWTADGIYTLCVQAANACDDAPPSCTEINVSSIPQQTFDIIICENEEYVVNEDITLTEAGNYEYNFLTSEGCDSTFFVNLEVFETSVTQFDIDICEDDTIFIGNTPFFEAGEYVEILPNYLGCDSVVELDLGLVVCLIQGESSETPVVCNGDTNGQIDFFINSGTPPFTYTYENLNGTVSGTGGTDIITALNEVHTIENLPAGTYLITVNDSFGNLTILIQDITEAPVLTSEFALSDYNSWNISCFAATDGDTEILPQGGVSPYSYLWSTGDTDAALNNLTAGTYSVTITDDYGCEIVNETNLSEPALLQFIADFGNASCESLTSGFVQVTGTFGGTAPYVYDFGAGFSDSLSIGDLGPGAYTATVQDANGCEADTTATITAALIPEIDLGEDLEIFLGDATPLNIASNITLDSNAIVWTNTESLDCNNCPNPTANPLTTTSYTLTLTSEDDCVRSDSVTVFVIPRRRVYVPNAFSPDFDGVNDVLRVYGGNEVLLIRSFRVWSRRGDLIYEASDFEPNESSIGWDGSFRGQNAAGGVYLWSLELTYLDGLTGQLAGDVLLVR